MELSMTQRLVLASASPRRIELLTVMGLDFDVVPSDIEESSMEGEGPQEHALRLSREKARAVALKYPRNWILGADTIVVVQSEILGKPADRSEAKQMLEKLRGRVHDVYTGFTLLHEANQTVFSEAVRSRVVFRHLTDDEIAWYIATPEPYDKAGAYAVQGMGAFFIQEIHGSYTNVMGLPLCELADALKRENLLIFA